MMQSTRAFHGAGAVRRRVLWSALVVVALLPGLTLRTSPAYANTSATSPGAAAAVGVSEEAWAAFLLGHGELTGASVAAPVAGTVATAAAAAASLEISSPGLLGKATALLGGFGKWFLGIGDPAALPTGAPSLGDVWPTWMDPTYAPPPWATWTSTSPTRVTTFNVGSLRTGTLANGYPANGTGVIPRLYDVCSPTAAGATWTNPALVVYGKIAMTAGYQNTVYNLPSPSLSNCGSGYLVGWVFALFPGGVPGVASGGNYASSVLPGLVTGRISYVAYPPSSSPPRHVEQTITCKNAAGVLQTVTSSTANALWSTPGEMIEVAGLMCPLGSRAVGVEAVVKTDGGADVVVIDEPYVPGSGLDAVTGSIPELCYSGTTCTLELERTTGSDTWARVNPEDVPGWWTDPTRDLTYRCVYGAGSTWAVLSLSACEVYKTPDTGLATPTTVTDPPPSDPSGDCSFGWSDLLSGGIFIQGSKCVIRWAFTPTPGTMDGLKAQMEARAPFSVAVEAGGAAQSMVTAYSSAGACGSIADFTTDDIDGLIACDAFSKIPGADALRALIGVVLVMLTGLYVFNLSAARFGPS